MQKDSEKSAGANRNIFKDDANRTYGYLITGLFTPLQYSMLSRIWDNDGACVNIIVPFSKGAFWFWAPAQLKIALFVKEKLHSGKSPSMVEEILEKVLEAKKLSTCI